MKEKVLSITTLTIIFLLSFSLVVFGIEMVHYVGGRPGDTLRVASSDSAQDMDTVLSAVWTDSRGKTISRCVITCESYNIRVTFGDIDPVQSGTPLGHILYVGQSLTVESPNALATMRFINEVNGANGILMVTPEYNPSR